MYMYMDLYRALKVMGMQMHGLRASLMACGLNWQGDYDRGSLRAGKHGTVLYAKLPCCVTYEALNILQLSRSSTPDLLAPNGLGRLPPGSKSLYDPGLSQKTALPEGSRAAPAWRANTSAYIITNRIKIFQIEVYLRYVMLCLWQEFRTTMLLIMSQSHASAASRRQHALHCLMREAAVY